MGYNPTVVGGIPKFWSILSRVKMLPVLSTFPEKPHLRTKTLHLIEQIK